MSQEQSTIKAVVMEVHDEVLAKTNGSEFVRTVCKVTESNLYPKLVGMNVFANRTITTNGKSKSMVDIGDEVLLHHSHNIHEGKSYHFFEIQIGGVAVTDSAQLDAIFGV